MRPNYCLTMLHVSIFAALLLTLEADSEDSDCEVEIRVWRNTLYEVFLGDDLRMNCTVVFCNNSPPTVSWYKLEKLFVPVSRSSDIKTEWKRLNHSQGILYLVFQNILTSDSGVYQCGGGGSVSHNINVSVNESSPLQDTIWPYVYRVVGLTVFFTIIITLCVISQTGCKGVCCSGESRDTPDPSCQPSHHASPTIHIYENDQ